jgi:hypothetical protein
MTQQRCIIEETIIEMQETEEEIERIVLSQSFYDELARIRLDLGISPFVSLNDEMCKWVLLADKRSKST